MAKKAKFVQKEQRLVEPRADSGGSLEKKKTAAKGRKVEREQTFEIQARADSGGSLEKKKVIKRSPRVSRNVRNRDLLQAI